MFGLFKKKYSESEQRAFMVKMLSELLAVQCGLAGKSTLDDADGKINRKALGYICGFCDGAFQVAWKQGSDRNEDYATTAKVLMTMYGIRGGEYMDDALLCVDTPDTDFNAGLMNGGQEYVKWARTAGKAESYMPMGLVQHLNNW